MSTQIVSSARVEAGILMVDDDKNIVKSLEKGLSILIDIDGVAVRYFPVWFEDQTTLEEIKSILKFEKIRIVIINYDLCGACGMEIVQLAMQYEILPANIICVSENDDQVRPEFARLGARLLPKPTSFASLIGVMPSWATASALKALE